MVNNPEMDVGMFFQELPTFLMVDPCFGVDLP